MNSKYSGILAIALCLDLFVPLGNVRAQNVLEIPNAAMCPGDPHEALVLLSHDRPLQGFQVCVTYDVSIFRLERIDFEGLDLEELLAPETVEFFVTTIDNRYDSTFGLGSAAAIFDSSRPFTGTTLPPGCQQSILRYSFRAVDDSRLVGSCTSLNLTRDACEQMRFVDVLVDGDVCFDCAPFIRGDADGNGVFDGLLDALTILRFQFIAGDAPRCLEAADVDGNGVFNGLFDAIYGLNHHFAGGPAPPHPYPRCGLDLSPTTSLSCLDPPFACLP